MEKYENMGLVGEGSYGIVMKCRHRESGQLVAVKKFIESEDDRMVKKIALREVRMLKQLRHENLVNLLDVFRRKKRLFLVFEFVDHTILDDLERNPTGLDEVAAKRSIWQVIRGIEFCHNHSIIHRDVKPENVLVSKAGVVKLCDFGFARTIAAPGEAYTDYVATRWYRAPELLVGDTSYGKPVDVWAIGCLLAEMLTGEPLFPGDSDIDQLHHITRCFGNLIQRHKEIFMRNPLFVGLRLPDIKSVESLSRKFPRISPSSHLAIKKCLKLEPKERLSTTELLQDDYFKRDGFLEKVIPEVKAKIRQEIEENPLLKKIGIKLSDDTPAPPQPPKQQIDRRIEVEKEKEPSSVALEKQLSSPATVKSPPTLAKPSGEEGEEKVATTVTIAKVPKRKKEKKKDTHHGVKLKNKDNTGSDLKKYHHYLKKAPITATAAASPPVDYNRIGGLEERGPVAGKPSIAVAPTVKSTTTSVKVSTKLSPSIPLSTTVTALPHYPTSRGAAPAPFDALNGDEHKSSASMAESVNMTSAVSITTLASRGNHGETSRTVVTVNGGANPKPSSPPIQIELMPPTSTNPFKTGKTLKKSISKDSKGKLHTIHHHHHHLGAPVTLPQLDERARTSSTQLVSTTSAASHPTVPTSMHKKSVLSPISHYQNHHDSYKGSSSPFTNPTSPMSPPHSGAKATGLGVDRERESNLPFV